MEVVKHEIKSQLAKLLATEDLIVEHKSIETAQFDVHTRVLTLPSWDRASNNIYDSLVAHEVGHALYTPDEWGWADRIPPQFVNIVEDVRIEKFMKRRYAGIAKTFYNGYNELHDRDFFELDGKDINSLNLADRINIYFKVGSWVDISFSPSETSIVNLIKDCETFEDTLSAAETLYNFCKQEHKKRKAKEQDSQEDLGLSIDSSDSSNSDNMSSFPDPDSSDSMEDGSDDNALSSNDVDSTGNIGGITGEGDIEIETADALDDALRDLTNTEGQPSTYFELPKLNLEKVIVSNTKIHNGINSHWVEEQQRWKESDYTFLSDDIFQDADKQYVQFKRDAQKEVNYLVKEFECRKAASSYARATTSRTGILDTTKLHSYRYNEDLFKKVTTLADGKSHGLIFILDWSGSMGHVMMDTVKQLYNLLWFCRKVNIPFEVYAFTNEYPRQDMERPSYEKKEGMALIENTFSLMNILTSKVRNKEMEIQMKNIFRIACGFNNSRYGRGNNWTQYTIPLGMNLSGTPLNETLIALHQIIPQFQNQNKLEKVQCVILTDGEAAPLRFSKIFKRSWESEGYMGSNYVNDTCVLRNRKTGYTYSCRGLGHWADVTDLLIKDLRQTYPNTNFIGIRILESRDAGQFVRRYAGYLPEVYDKIMAKWRREKSFSIKNSGYHTYFGLSSNALANDDEFEVKEDATKAQIKSAFVKSLKTKKMNKRVLGEFIELVA